MIATPIIHLETVSAKYGDNLALNHITLSVQPGEILTLLGPNGSGKSTLLHVLGLLRRPNTGLVYFHGEKVTWGKDLLGLRRRMATVFQQPLLLDTTVASNVALGLQLRGKPGSETRARVAHWLERLGISGLASRPARALSGGEAQRVSMARALVLEPEVLFLDEPLKELDTPTRETLIEELKSVLQETQTTTVFVTHDRTEALRLSDRVAFLKQGHLLQVGTTEDVFGRPASEEVATFVGVETILNGRVTGCEEGLSWVEVTPGKMIQVATECQVGRAVLISLRPEDVTILGCQDQVALSSARNRLRGAVASIQQLGYLYRVYVDAGGFILAALITKQSFEDLGLAPGISVDVSFKATAAHVIPRVH